MEELINDEQLLDLLSDPNSSEKGFSLLVEKYQERLYWHIRRMVIDHHDTDDVLQNTFIKVYRHIAKFEKKSNLYTWIYRIASNESITFINKKKKKATLGIEEEWNNIGNKLKADEYFDGDRAQTILIQAVAILPDKQKLVFNYRYFENMSYADISDIVGTSVGGLKASYHIAVKKIESYLKATSF